MRTKKIVLFFWSQMNSCSGSLFIILQTHSLTWPLNNQQKWNIYIQTISNSLSFLNRSMLIYTQNKIVYILHFWILQVGIFEKTYQWFPFMISLCLFKLCSNWAPFFWEKARPLLVLGTVGDKQPSLYLLIQRTPQLVSGRHNLYEEPL